MPDPPIIQPMAIEAFKTLELNVGFITSFIQRIGTVIAHDVPHVPVLMMDDSPLYVNTFNVRTTLLRANRDPDFFNHLMDNNPIPGLIVRAGRITNGDEIMPAAYDAATV
ncbi:unnamed protein product [Arctia plantaginis]|uniref:Uncharacterized protein n=1 Tax=Arctia plantaginis TaxID=874455 RepID=A0A8S0ZEM2_ARCPL|nr:unnamed protein product [Arctia plantaginis]CAB3262491.1 unnamed protein product [Arctia plantaginis]